MDTCKLVDLFRVATLIAEAASYEPKTQIAGVQIIVDMGGLTRSQALQFKYDSGTAKKILKFLQVLHVTY